jgi:hypothetical protein
VLAWGRDGVGRDPVSPAKGCYAAPSSLAPAFLGPPAVGATAQTNVTIRGVTALDFKSETFCVMSGPYLGDVQIFDPLIRPEPAPSGGGALAITARFAATTLVVRRPTISSVQRIVAKFRASSFVARRPTQVSTAATDFFNVGSPVNWWKLTTAGGLRPSFTSYDSTSRVGPRASTFYDAQTTILAGCNARRGVLRGTPRTDLDYWPRVLGSDVQSLSGGTNLLVGVSNAALYTVGQVVYLDNCVGKDPTSGKSLALSPSPNGKVYTVKSKSGSTLTMNEGWVPNAGSGIYDASTPGYLGAQKKNDTVYEVNVTQATIGTLRDSVGPLFALEHPGSPNSATNRWVWQGGKCHRMYLTGNTDAATNGGHASLFIRIKPNLDVVNASAEMTLHDFTARDPQLFNPFCHVEWQNVDAAVEDGMVTEGMCGGLHSYVTLGGLSYPVGEGFGFGGCSGIWQGVMQGDLCYDAHFGGQGAANIQWWYCSDHRNRMIVAAGGGHTDDYQLKDVHNETLPAAHDQTGATWYRCYLESGGNAMVFQNSAGTAGSASHYIDNCWALECIFGTGNKAFDMAACRNGGARRCLFNGVTEGVGGMVGKKPTPLDLGNNNLTHPYPTGNLVWPDTTHPDANLLVALDGSKTAIARVAIPSGATFVYIN